MSYAPLAREARQGMRSSPWPSKQFRGPEGNVPRLHVIVVCAAAAGLASGPDPAVAAEGTLTLYGS